MTESNVTIVDEPVEAKHVKKLTQLAEARESAKLKRKQRDDDLSAVNSKLEKLTAIIEAKQPPKVEVIEPEVEEDVQQPVKKRKVVVTRQEAEEEPPLPDASPTWLQSIFRTTAVLALGAGSYYFQNVYGKQKTIASKTPQKATKTEKPLPVWNESKIKTKVGDSGFVL